MDDVDLGRFQRLASKPFEVALRFLRLTGCRLSELFSLSWEMVDFERRLAILPHHKSRRKTGKPRLLILIDPAVELLSSLWRDAIERNGTAVGRVFLNSRGKPWTRGTLGQTLARLKERHGIKTAASLHGIRHRWGTEAVKNGASIKLISLAMGHATTHITERFYCDESCLTESIREASAAAQAGRRPS